MPEASSTLCTIRVRDIMKSPVHTVQLDDSLRMVQSMFERIGCHHVVVMERSRVFGVVSDRDILRAVSPFVGHELMERQQDVNTLKKRVHQIMSREPVTVDPDRTVMEAAALMLDRRVSSLPVVDESGKLVGIMTTRDVLAWAVSSCGIELPPRPVAAG